VPAATWSRTRAPTRLGSVHDERAFLDARLRGLRDQARGRHELVVAAARMDRVEQERRAVAVQRHPPDQAVEAAGERIAGESRRALREPDRVDELGQQRAVEARPREARVDDRRRRVDVRDAVVAPERPAGAIVVVAVSIA
jgi:hypothetical protein